MGEPRLSYFIALNQRLDREHKNSLKTKNKRKKMFSKAILTYKINMYFTLRFHVAIKEHCK